MELFSTDRDRLTFLLKTDAALDLDFEALEARVGAAAEEPSPERCLGVDPHIRIR